MKWTLRAFAIASLLSLRAARAEGPVSRATLPDEQVAGQPAMPVADGDYSRTPAFEVNVLWPFFPGGIVDLKALVPIVREGRRDFRGELITGLHSDFGWGGLSRPVDQYGKVSILAAKLGYRQFLVSGLHVEWSVNVGWRHEERNIHDGERLDGFIGRSWFFAGYQHEFSRMVYANVRGGGGVHMFRSDRWGHTERAFVPAGDLNFGMRF